MYKVLCNKIKGDGIIMNIYAVVDRLEDGNVVLVSDDYGLEVRIPVTTGIENT